MRLRAASKACPHRRLARHAPSQEFCAKYDAAAFDPEQETLPLSFFEPMLRRVLAKPKRSLYKKSFDSEPAAAQNA